MPLSRWPEGFLLESPSSVLDFGRSEFVAPENPDIKRMKWRVNQKLASPLLLPFCNPASIPQEPNIDIAIQSPNPIQYSRPLFPIFRLALKIALHSTLTGM